MLIAYINEFSIFQMLSDNIQLENSRGSKKSIDVSESYKEHFWTYLINRIMRNFGSKYYQLFSYQK